MKRQLTAGLALLGMLVAACAPDPVAPDGDRATPPAIYPATVDDALVTKITEGLECLYADGVVPNPQSTIGKLNTLVGAIEADDALGALGSYDVLYGFLYKWQNAAQTDGAAPVTCDPWPDWLEQGTTVGGLFGLIYADLATLMDGLEGEFCTGTGGFDCIDDDGDAKSMVYFPPDIFSQLTSVYIENNPTGFSSLQGVLDEYPTYVRIITTGVSDFTDDNLYPQKPLVVVCFNSTVVQNPVSLLSRLLLGSKHTNPDLTTAFKLLARPMGSTDDTDTDLGRAYAFCGQYVSPTSSLGLSNTSFFGRMMNQVAEFVLPEAVQAQFDDLAFGGVGGSAEEFSEFGAVDPGMDAFGGVGGSAEEFAPGVMPGAAAGPETVTSSDNTHFVGDIGEIFDGTGAVALPSVTVVAPGSRDPIPGVTVRFELVAPSVTGDYAGLDSDASFCGGTANPYEVDTDASGQATAPCINFGPTPGYKNLRVTVQTSDVDPLACIITPGGACSVNDPDGFSTQSVNFLLETYEPPTSWACTLGSKASKVNFGDYTGGYWHAWLEAPAPSYTVTSGPRGARIRQVAVIMSVTGRSSSESNWPVLIEAFQGSTLLASGSQTLKDGVLGGLRLPGDNGNGIPVTFVLSPVVAPDPDLPVYLRVSIASESNRVPQVWYNSSKLTDTDDCYDAVAYQNGKYPTAASAKETYRGLIINLNNYPW